MAYICCSDAACVFHAWTNRDSVLQYCIKQEYFCGIFRAPRTQRSFPLYLAPRNRYAPLFTPFLFCTSQALCNLSLTRHFFSLLCLFKGLLPSSSELRSLAFIDHHPFCIRFSNAMMTLSEKTIALFRSRSSSTRNRALLYVGITDGNHYNAVALVNYKPNESFRAALSRPATQFRRSLAIGAKGY